MSYVIHVKKLQEIASFKMNSIQLAVCLGGTLSLVEAYDYADTNSIDFGYSPAPNAKNWVRARQDLGLPLQLLAPIGLVRSHPKPKFP